MIIDTHLHTVDRTALDYPWLEGVEPLDRDWILDEYARQARRAGISMALHMEVDVAENRIEDETAYVNGLADRPDTLIGGVIASCRPEHEGFAGYLERASANPLVKGFRRVLHVMPDELSEQPVFRENLRRLGGTGLTFDICVLARQLRKAIALADVAPDVVFILDHCGVPEVASESLVPWRDDMAELAKRPNVLAKISGVVAYADSQTWTVETLRPWVEHTIACFGWERVVWGSDWPVCTLGGGLMSWVAATHALLEGASGEERGKLLAGNARRIWKL